MKKATRITMISISFIALAIILLGASSAVSQDELDKAKSLIDNNTRCSELNNEQLELIGEYYMEQMHPGEAHERMDKIMGLEEDSENEEQFHISMAKNIYCNEIGGMATMFYSPAMMNMMMNNKNMMGGLLGTANNRGMMNSYYPNNSFNFTSILLNLVLLSLIILIIILIVRFLNKK